MSFDNLMVWLISAMGFTAVGFLLWTLAALVRTSVDPPFGLEQTAPRMSGLAPHEGD
jgi:hypothetical protein